MRLEEALVEAGQSLESDAELRDKIDTWIVDAVGYVAEQFKGEVADLIALHRATVGHRRDRPSASSFRSGGICSSCRINGTLVGGAAGLLIYTLSEMFLA